MPARRLGEFVRALRHAGLRVSPDEACIAMEAAALTGYGSRQQFYQTLALTLLKDERDRDAFDDTFCRFFDGLKNAAQGAVPAPDANAVSDAESETESDASEPVTGQVEAALSGELSLPAPGSAAFAQQMAQAAGQMDFTAMESITQQGLYARRLMMNMGAGAVDERILVLSEDHSQQAQNQLLMLRRWRADARARAASFVRDQFQLYGAGKARALRESVLRETAFRQVTEYQAVLRLIRKMARKLIGQHQRRLRRSKRGILDARSTFARSMRHDGIPIALHWRQRPPHKRNVMVICDVSSSVREAARFLLVFLSALNDVLPAVRCFAFASRFAEVTEAFNRFSAEQAVTKVLEEVSGSGTDYGSMFAEFWQQAEGALTRHTTVIILGDARNNGLPSGVEVLEKIQRRAGQVWWLNPESQSQWNSGDAIMAEYLPYCRHALRCRNLNDLSHIVDALLRNVLR